MPIASIFVYSCTNLGNEVSQVVYFAVDHNPQRFCCVVFGHFSPGQLCSHDSSRFCSTSLDSALAYSQALKKRNVPLFLRAVQK